MTKPRTLLLRRKRLVFVCVQNANRSQMAKAFARMLGGRKVETMGCGDDCPILRAKKRLNWDVPDPKHMPPAEFRAIRDLIGQKVQELLAGSPDRGRGHATP